MGVTRLERKGRKNKTVAKVRVATIKRLRSKVTVGSDYKDESGVVVGDVEDVLKEIESQPKPAKKQAEEKSEAKAEAAPAKEEAKEKAEPKAKKPAAKKSAATKKDDSPKAKKSEKDSE